MIKRSAWVASMAVALCGCASVGPTTVRHDRFDYATAIGDSWKQQTLLNIVKLRYMDQPIFLDVASIVAGYSLQAGVSAGGAFASGAGTDVASVGGQAIYTERPTITYVPMTGEAFLRGLITPIDPKNIFFMLQSGYAADFILGLTVESLNGLRNRSTAGGAVREADPEFVRALALIRDIQAAGAFGMRVEEDKAKGRTAVVFFKRDDLTSDITAKSAELHQLLRLPADQSRFALTYSPVRGADNELTVNSRSMLQIMAAFSTYLDVPGAHLKDGSALAAFEDVGDAPGSHAVHIRSGTEKPADPYVAVRYRGHWYWIEQGDWHTKRALAAVMFFFTLTDSGPAENLPLITIPAQ